jgi:hypothetical protein
MNRIEAAVCKTSIAVDTVVRFHLQLEIYGSIPCTAGSENIMNHV